jgi:hypothetical protein
MSMANTPHATQGPSWATGASGVTTVVRSASAMLPFVGEDGRSYGLVVNNQFQPSPIMLAGSSTTNVAVTLTPGRNHICALADTNQQSAAQEVARECIDVIYVP